MRIASHGNISLRSSSTSRYQIGRGVALRLRTQEAFGKVLVARNRLVAPILAQLSEKVCRQHNEVVANRAACAALASASDEVPSDIPLEHMRELRAIDAELTAASDAATVNIRQGGYATKTASHERITQMPEAMLDDGDAPLLEI
jgi:hypothetical protein